MQETREIIERVVQAIDAVKAELKALPPLVAVTLKTQAGRVSVDLFCDNYQLQMAEILEVSRVEAQSP